MLRLSKLTDYAIVILSFMAQQQRTFTAVELAGATGIALPTVSKILKLLLNSGVLLSIRGAKGGYSLANEPPSISVAAIISAMEGPIALTECSISMQGCEQAAGCSIHANWSVINQSIRKALEAVSLADMIKPPAPTEVFIPLASLSR